MQRARAGLPIRLPIYETPRAGTSHPPARRCSVSPAQATQERIRRHEPDGPGRPLKVAARVRIPYGLPRSTMSEALARGSLSVTGLRCQWLANGSKGRNVMRGFLRQPGSAWDLRVYLGKAPVSGKQRYATKTVGWGKREALIRRPGRIRDFVAPQEGRDAACAFRGPTASWQPRCRGWQTCSTGSSLFTGASSGQ